MRKTLTAAAAGLACLLSTSAMAQDAPASAPAPAATPVTVPVTVPAPAPNFVPKNTEILVQFTQLVSSKTAKNDDMFDLKLAEPVMLNGQIVIPADTPGKGQVVDAGKAGMGGKPGKLVLAGRYLEFQGRKVPIHGLKMSVGGKGNVNGAMAASMLVGVFALGVTGGDVEVQPGMYAAAKLGEDFTPGQAADAASSPAQNPAPAPAAQPDTSGPASAPAGTTH